MPAQFAAALNNFGIVAILFASSEKSVNFYRFESERKLIFF